MVSAFIDVTRFFASFIDFGTKRRISIPYKEGQKIYLAVEPLRIKEEMKKGCNPQIEYINFAIEFSELVIPKALVLNLLEEFEKELEGKEKAYIQMLREKLIADRADLVCFENRRMMTEFEVYFTLGPRFWKRSIKIVFEELEWNAFEDKGYNRSFKEKYNCYDIINTVIADPLNLKHYPAALADPKPLMQSLMYKLMRKLLELFVKEILVKGYLISNIEKNNIAVSLPLNEDLKIKLPKDTKEWKRALMNVERIKNSAILQKLIFYVLEIAIYKRKEIIESFKDRNEIKISFEINKHQKNRSYFDFYYKNKDNKIKEYDSFLWFAIEELENCYFVFIRFHYDCPFYTERIFSDLLKFLNVNKAVIKTMRMDFLGV